MYASIKFVVANCILRNTFSSYGYTKNTPSEVVLPGAVIKKSIFRDFRHEFKSSPQTFLGTKKQLQCGSETAPTLG